MKHNKLTTVELRKQIKYNKLTTVELHKQIKYNKLTTVELHKQIKQTNKHCQCTDTNGYLCISKCCHSITTNI